MVSSTTYDVAIVGGGVIGLSLAYELAAHGASVGVLDRREPGREASWAGAGILPPGAWHHQHPTLEQFAALSRELYPLWSNRLQEESGIDNGYRTSGAVYLFRGGPEDQDKVRRLQRWSDLGIEVRSLDQADLAKIEPALQGSSHAASAVAAGGCAYFVPDEAQIRNPRHLKALASACRRRGVDIHANRGVDGFDLEDDRVAAVQTGQGCIAAGQVCLAAGCWSGGLAQRLDRSAPTKPIRGQMVLLAGESATARRIIHSDGRYVVPRDDGRVLVGSTVEDVGFRPTTTAESIGGLLSFAGQLAPSLAGWKVERCWAGLRPGSVDGLPYVGSIPGLENVWIATGHCRAGLQYAPATAVVMSALMRNETPPIDVAALAVERRQLVEAAAD